MAETVLTILWTTLIVYSIGHAIWNARTAPGALGWTFFILVLPPAGLPIYWVFGRYRFLGYVRARRKRGNELKEEYEQLLSHMAVHSADLSSQCLKNFGVKISRVPFTHGNKVLLLEDAQTKYEDLFKAIRSAEKYVLLQYYIVRSDSIGRRLQQIIIEKARQGVRFYILYDELGSFKTEKRFWKKLQEANVSVCAFNGRGNLFTNAFRLNFRNHRKTVVIDGKIAYVGGINIGDEYLGKDPTYGKWRDSHVKVQGPAVLPVQLGFIEDWYWSYGEKLKVDWQEFPVDFPGAIALPVLSGPADPVESCALLFSHTIHQATERIFISSPYFVPDNHLCSALEIAAMKGIDVQILIPKKSDSYAADVARYSYLERLQRAGVKFYFYQKGFLHQKIFAVDHKCVLMGSANWDNRSLRLNFETNLLVLDEKFTRDVFKLLEGQLEGSQQVPEDFLEQKGKFFQFQVKVTSLLSPVL